jgi:hypothetical protein
MKLSEHVDRLRNTIEAAFDKYLAQVGIGKNKQLDIEKISEIIKPKRLRFEAMLESHIGETGDYKHAREKLIDELTFTLFNRLAAVKVMESAALFPPILTKQPEHGDRSFGHKAWLEMNPHMRSEELEGIREYIKTAFDELGQTLPLFNRSYSYALLPDAISLNEIIESFNMVEKDSQVGSDIWQNDDVLGWMYESYNNVKKQLHKDSGDKTEYDKVSLQSQVYTPRWVVQFLVENSLGKLYLEMYPDSEIKRRFKIANAPQTQEREQKPLHEIKVIDPACGSGNFLLYAFDFFYELYVDQIDNYGADYDEKDIPKIIIENNLHGIDLDDRAVQLAQLGLFIKAKKKRRTIGELTFNIVSSDFYLPDYKTVEHIFSSGSTLDESINEMISGIWTDLQYAYKFGSLIRVDEKVKDRMKMLEAKQNSAQPDLFTAVDIQTHKDFVATFFTNLKTAVEHYAQAQGSTFLTSKTRDAITFLELLTTKYDVATTNPPYTDGGDFGPELKEFIEENYKKPDKFHTNLYAAFIRRCYELTGKAGKIGMIHPRTFMFIKTFEDVRKFMIEKTQINIFVDYSLSNLFGTIMVDPAFYILEKGIVKERETLFISLDQYTRTPNEKYKKEFCLQAITDHINGIKNEHNFNIPQSKLKVIKSWPFIYWISDEFREKFGKNNIEKNMAICKGLTTANNDRFLRYHWEVSAESISKNYSEDEMKWVKFAKGGAFNKWYGNLWLVVNWENQGHEIKNFKDSNGKIRSRPQNERFYFKSGITGSFNGSKGVSFRYLPINVITEGASGGIFLSEEMNQRIPFALAFFNSNLVAYICDCLNPTYNTEVGDLKRIPSIVIENISYSIITSLAKICISIKKWLTKFSLIEPEFISSPLVIFRGNEFTSDIKNYLNLENHLTTQVLINEAIINQEIFKIYDLTDHDKAMVLAKEGESIGNLPVSPKAREAYLEEIEATRDFPLDGILNFIETLPTKDFSTEERDLIESGFPTLYQSNNDLEEFCIRHQVNPINVWYWFKQSNVIPQQRMHTLAMEFLVDMVRDILMEDKDGIIPLVPNSGEKVLIDRIEDKFREKGFSLAQYSSFDTVLGIPVNEYLNKDFFAELSDHLNLFMYLPKTPFIWHLTSGPEQGFDCYIIIYKWSRDNLMRMRSVYIENRERSLVNRQSDLSDKESAEAQNEKSRIYRQLKEIETFKKKIDDLLAEGYNPILDDGVGKNIAPLQKKGMIPYEVLNAGQLKKYLNADW